MKNMRKLIAALLVLTLALALTGTAAMASCQFEYGDRVKFTRNTVAYRDHCNSDKTKTIVRKGSIAVVKDTYGDNWVELSLNAGNPRKTGWFRVANLKKTTRAVVIKAGDKKWVLPIFVCYSQGGRNGSDAYMGPFSDSGAWFDEGGYRISDNCIKHVKATASVWMHREPSLQRQYGRALTRNQKVTYRRKWALDDRLVPFYGIRYKGKCLWVSAQYTRLVK